ncbi:ornithine cyclodeaminase family protein [Pendulispora brunnea]|uniref:Ornithine cyclodeaminase family protein n=1 Tax=Pendulispora brunnea TaxID=2905690 RepID=A0ABZ2JZ19_9BACT
MQSTASSKHQFLRLVDGEQVRALLSHEDALQAVREAFVLHSRREGRVFPVVREALATGGVFGIKSGDVAAQGLLGFKAAGFWPNNRAHGGEPHQATIALFDPATGRPLCIIDGNAITTMRTGAAGGLALQELARRESTRLCVFGTGTQAHIQVEFALRLCPSLHLVRYVRADGSRDAKFEARFAGRCDIEHTQAGSAAVSESDIVITATPGRTALFDVAAIRPGTHFNCVGADTKGKRELPEGALQRVRLFVDDRAQARQIGEMQWATDADCMEFGDLLSGKETFHRRAEDVTLFDMTGLALQDLTVARVVCERAEATDTGTVVAWPW